MNARLDQIQSENTNDKAIREQIATLAKAIRMENTYTKHSAMEKLLSTEAGKNAVHQLLADNDPKKHPDMESPEYIRAVKFCREINKAIKRFIPSHDIDIAIEHKNNVTSIDQARA